MVNSVDGVDMFDKSADTMRMFRPKCRDRPDRQDSDQVWGEAKMNARSTARQTKLWVEPDIHAAQPKHYDIPLNNQQCFDFSY